MVMPLSLLVHTMYRKWQNLSELAHVVMAPAVVFAAQVKDEDAVVEGEGDVPDGQGDPVAPLLSCLHFSRFPVLLLVHFLLSLSLSAALVGGTSQAQEEKEGRGGPEEGGRGKRLKSRRARKAREEEGRHPPPHPRSH